MLFQSRHKYQQHKRNWAKAQVLFSELGDASLDHVRAQIVANAWQIREQKHWLRIEKHVRKLLRKQ